MKLLIISMLLTNIVIVNGLAQEKHDPMREAIEAMKRSPEGKFHKFYELARTAYSEKRYEDAVKFYTQALEQRMLMESGTTSAYAVCLYRADAKYQLGDYRGAINDCTLSISLDKKNEMIPSPYKRRAESKYAIKDYDGAIEDWTKMLETFSVSHFAYNGRGLAKYKLNQFQGALDDFDKAIKHNSGNPIYYENKGTVLIKMGQIENGCRQLSRAGELGSSSAYDMIRKHCQ